MPGLLENAGGGDEPLSGSLSTEADIESNNRVASTVEDGRLSARQEMSMAIDLETDRPVTAIEALRGAQAHVAENVAETLLGHLEGKYIGKERRGATAETETKDGQVVGYKSREILDA